MKINIRQAKIADKLKCFNLYKNAMHEHIEKIWGWNEEWQSNDFEKGFVSSKTQIVEVNRQFAGYMQIETRSSSLYIKIIILDQAYRSKGIGAKLISIIEKKAIELDKALELRVFKVNHRAIRFYKSNGFVIKADDENWFVMEKRLFK